MSDEVGHPPIGDSSLDHASPVVCQVKTMRLSGNRREYYVSLSVGDRELTPHVYRQKGRAEYDVARWKWLFEGGEDPCPLDFDTETVGEPGFVPDPGPGDGPRTDPLPVEEYRDLVAISQQSVDGVTARLDDGRPISRGANEQLRNHVRDLSAALIAVMKQRNDLS